jgi:hypothetical protein
MQFGCSYCSPKVAYHPRCSKKTGVKFSGFYGSLNYIIAKGRKKGVEKWVKRTRKRETVNDPIVRKVWMVSGYLLTVLRHMKERETKKKSAKRSTEREPQTGAFSLFSASFCAPFFSISSKIVCRTPFFRFCLHFAYLNWKGEMIRRKTEGIQKRSWKRSRKRPTVNDPVHDFFGYQWCTHLGGPAGLWDERCQWFDGGRTEEVFRAAERGQGR